jgi:hypothetical protein
MLSVSQRHKKWPELPKRPRGTSLNRQRKSPGGLAELASAPDRLIAAGLLFQQGVPPHATYLFKHAGFCEVDMVAHGGTSVAGSFIQTLTMVGVATGWTECMPLVTRDGNLVFH